MTVLVAPIGPRRHAPTGDVPPASGGTTSPVDWAHGALALIVIAWLNTGVAAQAVSQVPGWARWALLSGWLVIALLRDPAYGSRLVWLGWPVIFLLGYGFVVQALGGVSLVPYLYGLAYLGAVVAIYVYYAEPRLRPLQIALIGFLVIDYVIVGVNTFRSLGTDPMLARYLATSAETRAEVLEGQQYFGVGGYAYAYVLGAVVVMAGALALYRRRGRVLSLIVAGAAALLVVRASFAIAIVLAVCVLAALVVSRPLAGRSKMLSLVAGLAAIGAVATFSGPLLEAMARADWMPSLVAARLQELSGTLSGASGGPGFLLGSRLSLYGDSVETFTRFPVFGGAASPDAAIVVGGHSSWLDLLAVFGLPAVVLVVFLVRAFKVSAAHVGVDGRAALAAVWVYFLLLGLVNPLLFANLLLAWFLGLPLLGQLLQPSVTEVPASPADVS